MLWTRLIVSRRAALPVRACVSCFTKHNVEQAQERFESEFGTGRCVSAARNSIDGLKSLLKHAEQFSRL